MRKRQNDLGDRLCRYLPRNAGPVPGKTRQEHKLPLAVILQEGKRAGEPGLDLRLDMERPGQLEAPGSKLLIINRRVLHGLSLFCYAAGRAGAAGIPATNAAVVAGILAGLASMAVCCVAAHAHTASRQEFKAVASAFHCAFVLFR